MVICLNYGHFEEKNEVSDLISKSLSQPNPWCSSPCDEKKNQIVMKLKLKWWQNAKTQIVTKPKLKLWQTQILKNSNYEKLKLWEKKNKSKTQNVTKPKNSNYDKHKNLNCDRVQKLKLCQKLKLWRNSKTQVVTKLKNSNCDKTKNVKKKFKNSFCDKTQNFKLWQNSKTQIVTKLRNSNFDKTWNKTNINLWRKKTLGVSFSKNILTPLPSMKCHLGSVLQFLWWFWNNHFSFL